MVEYTLVIFCSGQYEKMARSKKVIDEKHSIFLIKQFRSRQKSELARCEKHKLISYTKEGEFEIIPLLKPLIELGSIIETELILPSGPSTCYSYITAAKDKILETITNSIIEIGGKAVETEDPAAQQMEETLLIQFPSDSSNLIEMPPEETDSEKLIRIGKLFAELKLLVATIEIELSKN